MKAKPLKKVREDNHNIYVECSIEEATHLELKFPLEDIFVDCNYSGEIEREYPLLKRVLPIQLNGTRQGTGNWSWNGSVDKPTVRPSVLTQTSWAGQDFRCHSWVNGGKVQFLSDCSHEYKNKTLDLLDID